MKMPWATADEDDDSIPIEVLPYLVPSERQIISVQRNRAVLIPPPCLLVADMTAFGLSAAGVIPGGAAVLAFLGALFAPSSYFLYRRTLSWQRAFFVTTNSRIILINWRRGSELTAISISEADDMCIIRTAPGRLLGYGSFLLRVSGTPGRIRKINYLPYPEQLYLEVVGLIYKEV